MQAMIRIIRKVIKIGSGGGVIIPAKEMRRQNIAFGDEVEVTVRLVKKAVNQDDQQIADVAKNILARHKTDFKNLSQR